MDSRVEGRRRRRRLGRPYDMAQEGAAPGPSGTARWKAWAHDDALGCFPTTEGIYISNIFLYVRVAYGREVEFAIRDGRSVCAYLPRLVARCLTSPSQADPRDRILG